MVPGSNPGGPTIKQMRQKSKLKELARERLVTVRQLLEEASNFGSLSIVETAKKLALTEYAIKWWLQSENLTWKLLFKAKQVLPEKEAWVSLYPNKPDLIEIMRH